MEVPNTSSSSHTYSCKSPESLPSFVLVLSLDNILISVPLCGQGSVIWCYLLTNMGLDSPSDDDDADLVRLLLARLSSRHDQEESQELRTQVRSYAQLSLIEIASNWNVTSGSWDTTRSILSSVRSAGFPVSNIWERTHNIETKTVQFTKLFFVSREPNGAWLALSSCQRVVTEKCRGETHCGQEASSTWETIATHS